MKRKNNASFIIAAFIFLLSNFLVTICCAQSPLNGRYYLHSKDFPSFDQLWTANYPFNCYDYLQCDINGDNCYTATRCNNLNQQEAQGVTHDDDNWFFAWSDKGDTIGFLFKIPVDLELNDNVFMNSRVSKVTTKDVPFLDIGKYDHFGDPDHYKAANGREYIIVPITSQDGNPPIIAIFQASDLRFVAYGELRQESVSYCLGSLHTQRSVGWCAVNPKTGILFTSEDFDYTKCFYQICTGGINNGLRCDNAVDCPGGFCIIPDCDYQDYHFPYRRELLRYNIPWDLIPTRNVDPPRRLTLGWILPRITMSDANGNDLELYNMQGGEFTPDGDLLYISSGSGCCFGNGPGQQYAIDGLHVFDTTTWRSIKRSYNHDGDFPLQNLPKYFDYYYPLGCDGSGSWSPEGLTIWDLDDGRAPHINGQLHVLLFKYRLTGANRQVFEHFSGKLYVDEASQFPAAWTNPPSGSKERPFFTFRDAFDWYPVWDGAEIVVKNGSYIDLGHYSDKVKITSQGGNATIGNSNTTTKGIVLYEHPDYKGDYRYFTDDVPDLDLGTINFADVTSSLRVYNVREVILYDGHNYTGSSFRVTTDIDILEPLGWNDRIGSLKIIR